MRRRPDGVRGVMEALIARSIEEAWRRGLAEVSLGLAPLAITPGHADALLTRPEGHHGRLDRFRRSRSLRHFKSKFAPAWEELWGGKRQSARPVRTFAASQLELPREPVRADLLLGTTSGLLAGRPRADRDRPHYSPDIHLSPVLLFPHPARPRRRPHDVP
jgi:hypothetical protein